jgi:hypothetical protein
MRGPLNVKEGSSLDATSELGKLHFVLGLCTGRGGGVTLAQSLEYIFCRIWMVLYSLQAVWCWKDTAFSIHVMYLYHKINSHFYVINIYLWRCIMQKSSPWLGYIWTTMGYCWTRNYWKQMNLNVLIYILYICILRGFKTSGDAFRRPHSSASDCSIRPFLDLFHSWLCTGCPRRNVPDFGRVLPMLKYTDITQNTYIQIWTVTEIMAREVWNFDSCYTLIDYQIHIKTGRNMWFL